MTRVDVQPKMLRWALERAGLSFADLPKTCAQAEAWLRGEKRPTLKQLEGFARATFVPVGYLFLSEPPEEALPIPDLRTVKGRRLARPSPNLLDTIHLCRQRQAWYRTYARSAGQEPLAFVGSATINAPVPELARRMREALDFDMDARRTSSTWMEALRLFLEQADQLGVLVMVNGVVGNNTHRRLDVDEFRGFALADPYAPLVFINGADTKAAQMFTLAHELVHIWLGDSALTNSGLVPGSSPRIETFCNRVAAELLVPLERLTEALPGGDPRDELQPLARQFKVSTLVILRRLLDARRLDRAAFERAYEAEVHRLRARPRSSGGDYYRTQAYRVGKRFARALIAETLEGQTLFRDAFQLLGIGKESTFREFSRQVGYAS